MDEVNDSICGLHVTMTGIGETISPIVASILNKLYGFTTAFNYYSSFLISYAILYIIICGSSSICLKSKSENEIVKVI